MLENAVTDPSEVLYDAATGRYVALKTEENLAIVYEKHGGDILIITAITSTKLNDVAQRRKRSGRWI